MDKGYGNQDAIGIGGGYYTYSSAQSTAKNAYESWFGEGGCWYRLWSSAGNGGIAGKGGTIRISESALIEAYNGDCITNNDYTTIYYEYDKDGNKTTIVKNAIDVMNENKQIIPSKIFAQEGIRRAVYSNVCYLSEDKKSLYPLVSREIIKNQSSDGTVKNIMILEEQNISAYGQGIGSGAGYIELSNGTYTVDESMN